MLFMKWELKPVDADIKSKNILVNSAKIYSLLNRCKVDKIAI